MTHLHITNGDVAAGIMREAGIAGEILPWRDVLHEGPVPAGLALDALSEVRAKFIADCGWAAFADARADFQARDAKLAGFRAYSQVTLWFEHDLYDQLQLLQLLDWFATRPLGQTTLDLICTDHYLGRMPASKLVTLYPQRAPVAPAQFALAAKAWEAFRAPEPGAWQALLDENTTPLPFLADAVLRHLEQFPSTANGLNRTERQLLAAVNSGIRRPGRLFDAVQDAEERVFMGDATFFLVVRALFEARIPLLRTADLAPFRLPTPDLPSTEFDRQEIHLTDAGSRVLANDLDWLGCTRLDKWLGGVHLDATHLWRWDAAALSVDPAPAGRR